jgi:hypothetical protein
VVNATPLVVDKSRLHSKSPTWKPVCVRDLTATAGDCAGTHGVEKLIPDDETLDIAWQRALMIAKINEAIDAVGKEFKKKRKKKQKAKVPRDLAKRLRDLLDLHPELPWDKALVRIAQDSAKPKAMAKAPSGKKGKR